MVEKIYEIKIVNMDDMSQQIRDSIINQVAMQPQSFRDGFKGFAKITFVSASPIKIKSIEPITGTAHDFFKTIKQGVTIPSF